MNNKTIRLQFASSLTDLCEVNSSFDRGILRVAYEGANRNGSSITMKAFENAIPSMANVPVVANYNIDENTIGGHDVGVVKSSDGKLRLINYTEPLGVVPESAKAWFDTVEEDDGTIHNYLYTEVLLWKRQPVYSKIKDGGITSHSMEISVKDGYMEDGIYVIDDFEFTAFCLLGDDVTPCFESSMLEVFSNDFKMQMSNMMQDLKDTIYSVNTQSSVDNILHPQKFSAEGGKEVLDAKMKLADDYGINVEDLDFSIEDLSIEELKEKFEEIVEANNQNNDDDVVGDKNVEPIDVLTDGNDESGIDEVGEDNSADDQTENFALTEQVVDEIIKQLYEEKVETAWGVESRYCYVDCDLELNEVYAHDITDWLLYGFKFDKNGDAIAVDFESRQRKKISIVDFVDEEPISTIAPVFERAEKAIESANEKIDAITEMETELDELRQYKANVETENAKSAREELFAQFEDIANLDECIELQENCEDMDIETLEEKLFAIRGKNATSNKFSLEQNKAPKLKVTKSDVSDDPYGGIVEKYLGND